jgi:hypothetical protein
VTNINFGDFQRLAYLVSVPSQQLLAGLCLTLGCIGSRSLSTQDGLRFLPQVPKLPDGSHLFGMFQSEQYFNDCADEIRSIFSLKDFLDSTAVNQLKGLRRVGPLASIHVRRGDYLNQSLFNVDLSDYYQTAIDTISNFESLFFDLFR